MIDTTLVLLEHLKSDSTSPLIQLVQDRIFVARLPEAFNNEQPAIMLFCRSGLVEPGLPVYKPSFQFTCYGGSELIMDAKEVYRALHDVLHGKLMKPTSSGMLMAAHEEILGQELIDPDVNWPTVVTFYTCIIRPR